MEEKILLQKAEKILSETRDKEVHLSIIDLQEEHKNVMRFAILPGIQVT